ncbi:hypothetical protein L3Q82_000866 [Scortum barcoo]|uniref:Uncharacterized protein n=1 Tax=Scortum barcoo TaxID=214431 RepID=A0ACB8WDH1_9TELE|nr:hypothetical protein L3Q82_000866 [Scortum barcoo]
MAFILFSLSSRPEVFKIRVSKLYSCELTVDTNTVNRKIELSDNNRKMIRVKEDQPYPDHPDRFDFWPQLLCETGLTGRCYWEVEWRGRSLYIRGQSILTACWTKPSLSLLVLQLCSLLSDDSRLKKL